MTRLWHNGDVWISCDHACHLARGSAGGEDYAMAVGTRLYAPRDGRIRWRNGGTGGWTLTLTGVDGVEYEAMHCSGNALGLILNGGGTDVREGQHVGYSGGAVGHPGAGSSTGPHCHEHYWTPASGRRPLSEIVTPTAPAGGGGIPFPDDELQGDDDMTLVNYGGYWYLFDTGYVHQINNKTELAVQKARGIKAIGSDKKTDPFGGDDDAYTTTDAFIFTIIASGLSADYSLEDIEALGTQDNGPGTIAGGGTLWASALTAGGGSGGGTFPTDYAKESTVRAVGEAVEKLPKPPTTFKAA